MRTQTETERLKDLLNKYLAEIHWNRVTYQNELMKLEAENDILRDKVKVLTKRAIDWEDKCRELYEYDGNW